MRTKFFNLVLASTAIAAALTTTAAFAARTVNVPFSFSVNGRLCPAGIYSVEQSHINTNLVSLKTPDARNSFIWTAGPGDPAPGDNRIILTFSEVGNTHVLQSLQYNNLVRKNIDRNSNGIEKMQVRYVQGQ